MFPDKSCLLEQITSAIKEKWCKENESSFAGNAIEKNSKNYRETIKASSLATNANNASAIKKLEERIGALECLNDQLIYFINFLIENLPDLVVNTLHADWLTNRTSAVLKDMPELNSSQPGPYCIPAIEYPNPTRREKDVLDLLVKGYCAKEIARHLFISEATVITHKKNLKEKFQARNTAELISKTQGQLRKTGK